MFLGFALLAAPVGRVRDLSHRRRPAADRRPAGAARRSRRSSPRGRLAGIAKRRPRPRACSSSDARLPGRPRGCAEVRRDLLPARRGLPDLRAQARAARADHPRFRPSRSSPTTADRPQRRGPARDRRPRRPVVVVVTRASTSASRGAADRRTAERARARPDPADHPAAAARLPRGRCTSATTSTSPVTSPSRSRCTPRAPPAIPAPSSRAHRAEKPTQSAARSTTASRKSARRPPGAARRGQSPSGPWASMCTIASSTTGSPTASSSQSSSQEAVLPEQQVLVPGSPWTAEWTGWSKAGPRGARARASTSSVSHWWTRRRRGSPSRPGPRRSGTPRRR